MRNTVSPALSSRPTVLQTDCSSFLKLFNSFEICCGTFYQAAVKKHTVNWYWCTHAVLWLLSIMQLCGGDRSWQWSVASSVQQETKPGSVCFCLFFVETHFCLLSNVVFTKLKKKKKKQVICMHLKFPSHVKMVTDVKRWHFWQEQMLGKCQVFISPCENTRGKFALWRLLCKKHDTTWLRALH